MIPFFDAYGAILAWVFEGKTEVNERTGTKVRVGRGGTAFRVDLSDGILPTIGFRKTFPRSAAAEVAWFLSGERDVSFIRKYAPMWDKFVQPITVRNDLFNGDDVVDGVESAYGYRWRKHFGRDQLQLAVDALHKDPSDRRVYVSAWDPATDGLGAQGQKNVPCPTSFNLCVLDGELHSSLFLRSSDVFVGLPYDVMGHALLMDAISATLGIQLGVMHVTLAHAHLYDCHWQMTMDAMNSSPVVPQVRMPGWTMDMIESNPDAYVFQVGDTAAQHTWPSYNPKPHIVE